MPRLRGDVHVADTTGRMDLCAMARRRRGKSSGYLLFDERNELVSPSARALPAKRASWPLALTYFGTQGPIP